MDIGKIDETISRAIAQLERAKLRLLNSLDICYPGMVGAARRAEIRKVNTDLAMACSEMRLAEQLTMDVVRKWGDFTRENEEREGSG